MPLRSVSAAIVLFSLALVGVASADEPTNIDASMDAAQKARAAYRAGRYTEAARGYERAYELYPQLSYLEKVAKAYEKEPKACTQAEQAWRRFIRVCGECDKRVKALRRIEAVVLNCGGGLDPKAPLAAQTRYREGRRLLQNGRWKEAIMSLQVAADLWPKSPPILRTLGRALERSGDVQKAINIFERVVQLDGKASDITSIKALISSLRKQVEAQQGHVVLETKPHGALIFVGGSPTPYAQKTPAKLVLSPGRHRIELRREGYESAFAVVLVEHEKSSKVSRSLRPLDTQVMRHWVPWTLGSVGVATIATGLAFHLSAADTADDISRVDRAAYDRDADYIQLSEGLAWTSYAVGAALITAAVLVSGHQSDQLKSTSLLTGFPMTGWTF